MSTTYTHTGNLARDPEIRYTQSGNAKASALVIENRRRRGEGDEWEDLPPNVFAVEVWGAQAENFAESCRQGDRVIVVGRFVTERWADKETGEERERTYLRADEVGYSMRYHTVTGTQARRKNAPQA